MAEEINTKLPLARDHNYPVIVRSKDGGTAIDITGWALSFMVKRRKSDSDANALLNKTTASGISIGGTFDADPAVNTQEATVSIADTDTLAIKEGTYYYEVERTDAGFETTLVTGTIECIDGVQD